MVLHSRKLYFKADLFPININLDRVHRETFDKMTRKEHKGPLGLNGQSMLPDLQGFPGQRRDHQALGEVRVVLFAVLELEVSVQHRHVLALKLFAMKRDQN